MDVADMAMIIAVQKVAQMVERQLQLFQHQLQQLVHNQ
jgi:hypothetical protein